MDGGDHRETGGAAEHGAHHIAAGTVAVDEIVSLSPDFFLEQAQGVQDVPPGVDLGANVQFPSLLGKGALQKTDHRHVNGPGEILQQGEHVGFRAAAVTAADEMDDFHDGLQKVLES